MITPKTKVEIIKQITSLLKKVITESNEIEKAHTTIDQQNGRTIYRVEVVVK